MYHLQNINPIKIAQDVGIVRKLLDMLKLLEDVSKITAKRNYHLRKDASS